MSGSRGRGTTLSLRIALLTASISVVVALLIGVPAILALREEEVARLTIGMERDAVILVGDLQALPPGSWNARLSEYARLSGARVTVVDRDSYVLFDSADQIGGARFIRPELNEALAGKVTSSLRGSVSLGQPLYFSAAPIRSNAEVTGALRLAMPMSAVDQKINPLGWGLAGVLSLVATLGVLASWLVAAAVTRPLQRLAEAARDFHWDPSQRLGATSGPLEVRELGDALDETAARLDAALTRSNELAVETSHHLRTPLAALRLRIEEISDLTSGEVHANAEKALAEVDRLNRRVEQLLTIAKTLDEAETVLVEVPATVFSRSAHWADIAVGRGLEVKCEVPDAVLCARLPPGTVERTLDELVSNGLEYAESLVSISYGADDERVWIEVTDDGPGIPEAERELVFERFVRGSQARPGGTGLGLAMIRDAARTSGGDLVALDSPAGARLRVTWPRCKMD